MQKLAISTALLTFGITLAGCGGKAETVEAEKATTPTTANTAAANVNTTVPNTANTNADYSVRPDRDRDDVRSGKTNANSNSTTLRRDADDRGKHDNDRDNDRDADDQ